MTDRELMQQALEALEWLTAAEPGDEPPINAAIAALRERLAQHEALDKLVAIDQELGMFEQPVQEPVRDLLISAAAMAVVAERQGKYEGASWVADAVLNNKVNLDETAKQISEPVAMRYDFDGYGYKYIDSGSGSNWQTRIKDAEPLYAAPVQRRPLTDEQINDIARYQDEHGQGPWHLSFARAIEAAHGIKGETNE